LKTVGKPEDSTPVILLLDILDDPVCYRFIFVLAFLLESKIENSVGSFCIEASVHLIILLTNLGNFPIQNREL